MSGTRMPTYLRLFASREEARAHTEARNRASKDGTIHVLVDGPEDNFAVVDLETALDLDAPYEWFGHRLRATRDLAILAARIVLEDSDPANDDAAIEAVKTLLARWGRFWDPSSTTKVTSPAGREWYADRTMLSILERVRGEAGR